MNKLLPKSLIKSEDEFYRVFNRWWNSIHGGVWTPFETFKEGYAKGKADTLEAVEELRKRVLEVSMDKEVFIEYGQVEDLIYEIFPELKSEAKEKGGLK